MQIKVALYGLLRAITISDLGREAFAAIVRRAKALRHGHEPPPGQVALALRALRKDNPELAGQCGDAAREALCAILCAHGHIDRGVSVEVQSQVNQQDELVRLVERIAERIDGSGYRPIAAAK